MQKNKFISALSAGLLSMTMATSVFAATPISGVLVNNTTLVPLRTLSEAMGAEVAYEASTKQITVSAEGTTTVMHLDSTTATINGTPSTLAVAPTLKNDSTYVPFRFIGEAIGATVGYTDGIITLNLNGEEKVFTLSTDSADTNTEEVETPVEPEATANGAAAKYAQTLEGVTLPPSLTDIPEPLFKDMYKLDPATYSSYKIMMPQMSGVITEIAIVEATEGNVEAVKTQLQARLDALKNGGAFYPSHVEIVSKGQVVTNGNFVMMVADESVDTIVANFLK